MKLVNVRLNPDDARLAAELRRAGVEISRVLREAIRAEHGRRVGKAPSGRRAAEVMAEIYAMHPEPPGVPPRRYDLSDRRAARSAIVATLRRGRR